MAGMKGKSGPPGNMNAFKHGLAAIQKRPEDGVPTQHEENVRQQILEGFGCGQGRRRSNKHGHQDFSGGYRLRCRKNFGERTLNNRGKIYGRRPFRLSSVLVNLHESLRSSFARLQLDQIGPRHGYVVSVTEARKQREGLQDLFLIFLRRAVHRHVNVVIADA
jgi:hypothetical protein